MALEDVAREAGVPVPSIRLIAEFEGCLRKVGHDQYGPYLCPARVATIGMGTTVYNRTGTPVRMSDAPITYAKAEELLAYDIGKKYAPAVRRSVKRFEHVNQFGACTSFAYNVGTGGFKDSTMCWLMNQGHYRRAADEYMKWTRGGGRVLKGLVNRRIAERAMFLTPGPAFSSVHDTPAPHPVATPAPTATRGWFSRTLSWVFKRR